MKSASSERPDGRGLRLAVLRALFNPAVVDGLLEGALAALAEMGTARGKIDVLDVPGAFELPLAARAAALSGRYDAVVALGAVIKGETDHYEHVARAATMGLASVSLETGVPVGFGVLTVAEELQALRRAAPGGENKGAEAARAAVAMVALLRSVAGKKKKKKGKKKRRGRADG